MGLFKSQIKNKQSSIGWLLASLFVAITIASLGIFATQNVGAVTKTATLTPSEQAKAFVYFKALRTCFDGGIKNQGLFGKGVIKADEAQKYEWFYSGAGGFGGASTDVGVYGDTRVNGDGRYSCSGDDQGEKFVAAATKYFGYAGGPELLCDLGFTREVNPDACATIVAGADNDFLAPSDVHLKLDDLWTNSSKMGNSNLGPSGIGAGEYMLYYNSFIEGCKATPSSGGQYSIKTFNNGRPGTASYAISDSGISDGTGIRVYSGTKMTCGELASSIAPDSSAVKAYELWLSTNTGGEAVNDGGTVDPDITTNPTSCAVDGTGWIICSIATTMASAMDGMFNLLELYLAVQPLNVDTSSGNNTLFNAWSMMRNLANAAFVVAFLIIIFSQLTGAGVTNYGVKKMLPRLVISAILVNISYWISAIAVDLSNIIGVGVGDLFIAARGNLGSISVSIPTWEAIITPLLAGLTVIGAGSIGVTAVAAVAGTAAAGAAVSAVLWIVLTMLLGALLSVLVAILVLSARQALIVILIILSPLAFVAFLLPNTEKYFDLWRKSLTTMLIFYPIIAAVFAGSQLASIIILGSIGSATPDIDAPPVGHIIALAMFVQVAPLLLTPLLIKFSGGVVGKFAGMVNNKNRGFLDQAKNTRNRKLGLIGQSMAKAPPSRYKRGPLTGKRTIGGFVQSAMRSSYDGKASDVEQKSLLDNELSTASLERRKDDRVELIDRSGVVEDKQKEIKIGEEQRKENTRDARVDLRLRVSQQELENAKKDAERRWKEAQAGTAPIDANLGARGNATLATLADRAAAGSQEARVLDSATSIAQGVEQANYSREIQSNPTLAMQAGGIDIEHGASKAIAGAIEAERKAYEGNVAAHGIRLAQQGLPDSDLLLNADNTTLSLEERDAANRAIVNGGNIDAITLHQDNLANALNNAQTAGNSVEIDNVKALQKSFGNLIGSSPGKPMGLGAADIAAYKTGSFLPPTRAGVDTTGLTVTEIQTLNTVEEKGVSMDKWATMDKADIARVSKLAAKGLISSKRMGEIKGSIGATLGNVDWKGRIQEREQGLLKELAKSIRVSTPDPDPDPIA